MNEGKPFTLVGITGRTQYLEEGEFRRRRSLLRRARTGDREALEELRTRYGLRLPLVEQRLAALSASSDVRRPMSQASDLGPVTSDREEAA